MGEPWNPISIGGDGSEVDYGKVKVCGFPDCITILNHLRSREHDFCSAHNAKGLLMRQMDRAARARAINNRSVKKNNEKKRQAKLKGK